MDGNRKPNDRVGSSRGSVAAPPEDGLEDLFTDPVVGDGPRSHHRWARVVRSLGVEPMPYVAPGVSVRRHWRLVAAVMIVAVGVALVVGAVRVPRYTSEARLIVGKTTQLNNLAATPGLAVAGQQLASSYSRVVATPAVQADIAKRLGGLIPGSVSASPVPQSPIIRVRATASNGPVAQRIALAGSKALVEAVDGINAAQAKLGTDLITEYRQADGKLLADTADLQALQKQLAAAGASASGALKQQVLDAQTLVDADTLHVRALEADYQGVITPAQLDEQIVQPMGGAGAATNDRVHFLEMAVFVALVVGLLLGVGIAVAVDRSAGSQRVAWARGDLGDGGAR